MRDSLLQVTTALTGSLGTTVYSSSIGLGHDAAKTAVSSPTKGYDLEVYYPAVPTGTSPSIQATIQDSLDDSTFVDRAVVHATESTTTSFPMNRPTRFTTRAKAESIRIKYVLANTDNVFGSVVASITTGPSQRSN